VGHAFSGCGTTPKSCHSEERSDEESLFLSAMNAERFLAPLGMTAGTPFLRKLLSRAVRLADLTPL
jgi:hypothetical protein